MAKESDKKVSKRRVTRLLAFLELEVDSLNRRNKLGLAENYRYSGNSFRDYLSTLHKKDISLSMVSEELLIAYQQWLWDRGVKRNTSIFYMRNLHAVYNKAVGQGLVADRKPFGVVRPTSPTRKSVLCLPNSSGISARLTYQTVWYVLGKTLVRSRSCVCSVN